MNYLIVSLCVCFVFGLGCGVYVLRDLGVDGFLIGIAPAFLHSLAFALVGWLLFERRIAVLVWCVLLAAIGIGFESAQSMILPVWLPNMLRAYSAHGVFDPLDVVATALGFCAGYALIGWRQDTSISCGTGSGMAHCRQQQI
jgi:hypothetical protein